MNQEAGGPAFPTMTQCSGMTLRDYFAAKALTGLISSAEGPVAPGIYAQAAYALADAMLEARKC